MSDEQKKGRKPDFHALQPITSGKGDNEKTYWNRVGAGWMLEEKEGVRVKLNSVPVDGEFVLMRPKEENAGS
jgi:hypothetical protein